MGKKSNALWPIALSALLLVLAGPTSCMLSEMGQELESSAKLRDEVEAELGQKPGVRVDSIDEHMVVTVTLPEAPAGEVPQAKAKIETIAQKHFPEASEIRVVF